MWKSKPANSLVVLAKLGGRRRELRRMKMQSTLLVSTVLPWTYHRQSVLFSCFRCCKFRRSTLAKVAIAKILPTGDTLLRIKRLYHTEYQLRKDLILSRIKPLIWFVIYLVNLSWSCDFLFCKQSLGVIKATV